MKTPLMITIPLLVIAILVGGPIATIWALNTLFALTIPFTLKTWAAALVVFLVVGGSSKAGSS